MSKNILERNNLTNTITLRAGKDYETNEIVEMAFSVTLMDPEHPKQEEQDVATEDSESDDDLNEEMKDYFDLDGGSLEDMASHLTNAIENNTQEPDPVDIAGTMVLEGKLVTLFGVGGYINVSRFGNVRPVVEGRRVMFVSLRPIPKYEILTVRAMDHDTTLIPTDNTVVGASTLGASAEFGVFACKDFDVGEVLEIANGFETSNDKLDNYAFGIEDAEKAVVMKGNISMINHSTTPNVHIDMDPAKGILLKALKTVTKGDELFVNYGRSWFHTRGMKPL